ncbi:S8 family peptidase [Marivirga sp. S37H4]|uniref:S8 family peptidase n=2 Tax=Marivirga aurantiaca TaxID=2802615 RepID=A0A935C7Q1_9BACT|nr:S8 family peptidase [Marivirga aurantiaca]
MSSETLKESGFIVYRRISDKVFIGKFLVDDVARQQLEAAFPYVSYEANHLWKLSGELLQEYKSGSNVSGSFWIRTKQKQQLNSFIRAKVKVLKKRNDFLLIAIDNLPLDSIINQSFILYLGAEATRPQAEATVLDLNLHPNRINAVHHYYSWLHGQGQTLSLKEPFYNINDIDLSGRYVESNLESEFIDNHAAQMATVAVGAGNSFITGKGVAGNAFHTSSSNAYVLPDLETDYERLDVQIQNHSYGTTIEPFYGAMAAMFDQSAMENPNLLHVFSSGNSGSEASTDGKYAGIEGFANLTGNFKQAKNILTVGSLDTTNSVINLSSKGPAYDGRVKPELVAYSMAGTSNSAAMVSGTAILLQQLYKELNGEPMPAPLLKGVLINSADDVHLKGIDYSTGFGQLNGLRAVENIENAQYFKGTVTPDEEELDFPLLIPENAKNLKITLIWNDPPANPNDTKALMNDLDLKVMHNQGVFMPMVLNTGASLTAIQELAETGEDHLNNIEQVVIESPEAGNYLLNVSAFDVAIPSQDFYILYQWDTKDSFRWTSPTASDNIPYNGETVSHLRWESAFEEDKKGELFYQLIVGENASEWFSVNMDVELTSGQYRWDVPDIYNLGILKMQIGVNEYLSDTFSISPSVRLDVGFNCTDSISFQWKSIDGVDSYEVKALTNHEMKPILTTSDTSVVLQSDEVNTNYFSVTPYMNGKKLLQSFTINYQQQGAGCYIKTFFIEAVQDSGVFMQLQLGATNDIKQIVFERLDKNDNWVEVSDHSPDQLYFRILDDNPCDGFNTYRAKIEFVNHSSIVSDSLTTYFVKGRDFIVYPNPVNNSSSLQVFSKKFEGEYVFQLSNTKGEVVMKAYLTDSRSYLDLPGLADGLYVYHIYQNGHRKANGKLLIVN